MSTNSETGSPKLQLTDTRCSGTVPELDDHREVSVAHRNENVPSLEIRRPTTQPVAIDSANLLSVDAALRVPGFRSRDFEQVIEDDDQSIRSVANSDVMRNESRRASVRARRLTNRQGRVHNTDRVNRSRESSSSRSTSPPNSVEAFAAPRRRERANTLGSQAPPSVIEGHFRTQSHGSTRRPTLSNVSGNRIETRKSEYAADEDGDVCIPVYEDPGKTLKIDYEALEEFVALDRAGLVKASSDDDYSRRLAVAETQPPKVFHDLREKLASHKHKATLDPQSVDEIVLEKASSGSSDTKPHPILGNRLVSQYLVGERPGPERFALFSSDLESTIHAKNLGGLLDQDTTFRDLFETNPDGGVWWLDCLNPTKSELEAICDAFHVHPLTLEDVQTQEAREKVELFKEYYFVCFRTFDHDKESEDFLEPVNSYIISCREGVLTFSYCKTPHAHNVRRRISKLRDFLSLTSDWICYAMIDDIVDSFQPIIRDAERDSENIEDQVFIAREDDYLGLLKQIGECRKRVLNMMRLLGGKADVIKGFAKRCNEQYSVTPRGDIGLYLGDIQDHVVTMMSNLGHVEKMLSRSHGNYLAQLNVDHLVKGNHTNRVLGKITLITTILVPLNLICGLFGMNVPVPGRESVGLGWFFGIVGVIIGFVLTCLLIARRMRAI